MARGEPVRARGSLEHGLCADFIYAPCAARAITAVLTHAARPQRPVYNIANGAAVPLRELLGIVPDGGVVAVPDAGAGGDGEELAAEADVQVLPSSHHLLACAPYNLDSAPLKAEFGWEPLPIREACGKYLDWIRAQQQQ